MSGNQEDFHDYIVFGGSPWWTILSNVSAVLAIVFFLIGLHTVAAIIGVVFLITLVLF